MLKSGDLIGAEVIVEGIIEGGRARALRTIELGAGAIFSEKAVSAPDLRIAPGAEFKFKLELQVPQCRNLLARSAPNSNLRASLP